MKVAVFLLLAFVVSACAQDDLRPGTSVHADPSTTPIKEEFNESQWAERFRFRADFNFDGIPDVLISDDLSTFGKVGGRFALYLGRPAGGFRYVGWVVAHPLAVHLARKHKGEGVISVYWRAGGAHGELVRYLVSKGRLKELPGKDVRLRSDASDAFDYDRYFSKNARLRAELSSTTPEGIVTWEPHNPDT